MKGLITQYMRIASAKADDLVARRQGARSPLIYVAEFPRSGCNWMRDMVGDALQLPVPRFSLFPTTFAAIAQTHSARPIEGPPCIYMVRDARDVFVSHYFKVVNGILAGPPAQAARLLKRHPSLEGAAAADMRAGHRMEAFYREWCVRSAGVRGSWAAHVTAWTENPPANRAIVRYEDLRTSPVGELRRALSIITAAPPPEDVVTFAVTRNEFERKTGRKSGEVDNTSNRRSGRPGAWAEIIPAPLAETIAEDFGPVLKAFGYTAAAKAAPSKEAVGA